MFMLSIINIINKPFLSIFKPMSKRNPNLQLKIPTKKCDFRDALNSMDNTVTIADTSSLCHHQAKRNSAGLEGA